MKLSVRFFVLLQIAGLFLLGNLQADETKPYVNQTVGFQIMAPAGWSTTEESDLMKTLEKNPQFTSEMKAAVESSGLVVTFSKFPVPNNEAFNPNISVSTKVIGSDAKPKSDAEVKAFTQKILDGLNDGEQKFTGTQSVTINGLPGLKSSYSISNGDKVVNGNVYILVDTQKDKYFILSSTSLDKGDILSMADQSIQTFQMVK